MAVMTYDIAEGEDNLADSGVQTKAGRLSTWIVTFLMVPWYLEFLTVILGMIGLMDRVGVSDQMALQWVLETPRRLMDITGGIFFPIALIWVMVAACRPMLRSRKVYMIAVLAGGFIARVVATTVFAVR